MARRSPPAQDGRRPEPERLTYDRRHHARALGAGVHFGHQTRRWNPKMKPFIFQERTASTSSTSRSPYRNFERPTKPSGNGSAGRVILFVGTKKQAADVVREEAERPVRSSSTSAGWAAPHQFCNDPKTNRAAARAREHEASGDFERLPKKRSRQSARRDEPAGALSRRHQGYASASRRALHRRSEEGTDRRFWKRATEDSNYCGDRYELRSRRDRLSIPGTTMPFVP